MSETGDGRYSVPATLDLTAARELRERLVAMLSCNGIVLDMNAVDRMSTPCVQVLLAAGRSADAAKVSFQIVDASDAFRAAIADLGLETQFCNWMLEMTKRILTVDDSKTMRDMVSFTLKKAGFDVAEAEDGKVALNVLGGGKFDLIITDLNMPNMDGITLIKNIRAGSQHRAVPILILTTESDGPRRPMARTPARPAGW